METQFEIRKGSAGKRTAICNLCFWQRLYTFSPGHDERHQAGYVGDEQETSDALAMRWAHEDHFEMCENRNRCDVRPDAFGKGGCDKYAESGKRYCEWPLFDIQKLANANRLP